MELLLGKSGCRGEEIIPARMQHKRAERCQDVVPKEFRGCVRYVIDQAHPCVYFVYCVRRDRLEVVLVMVGDDGGLIKGVSEDTYTSLKSIG